MACPHKQTKIDALNAEIDSLKQDINDLETNIEVYRKQMIKYMTFRDKINNCVKRNLEDGDNHISADSPYDNGSLDNILNSSQNQINELSNNINECNKKISEINEQISAKKTEIKSLQGDCSSCETAKRAAATLHEKQHHS